MRYTRQADRDILDIWIYVASSSVAQADRALDLIKSRCGQLADFPSMGPSRPDVFPGARVLVINRWLAIYQIENAGPQIVRVVDASRDLRGLNFPRE